LFERKQMGLQLSLIIPAYNEERRITSTLTSAIGYLSAQDYSYEIIVVDDGSQDQTARTVSDSFSQVRLLSYSPNRGKGFAVKTGMKVARGEHRVYYDADGSTPIDQIAKLWPCFERGADIVIGSRALPDSEIAIRQSWLREHMGRAYNLILRMMGLTRFTDTQCGFKGFTARAATTLFPLLTMNRFSFDAELLFLAEKYNFKIVEIPVKWINSADSRVRLIQDSLRMLFGAACIRWKWLRGVYPHEI